MSKHEEMDLWPTRSCGCGTARRICDRTRHFWSERDPKQRNIAMVFQNYALYPHMSVYQNLAYGLKNRGTPKAEIDARVAAMPAYFERTRFLYQALGAYPDAAPGLVEAPPAPGRAPGSRQIRPVRISQAEKLLSIE